MSNPRASIQRAVTAPPPATATASVAESPIREIDERQPARPLIGKAHGRMRSVNLCLPVEAAGALRRLTAIRESTLGEVLIDIVRQVHVPASPRAEGRRPCARRQTPTSNVYVLLTPAEASELGDLAHSAGRTLSDFAGVALHLWTGH